MSYYEIKYTTPSGETKTTSGHDRAKVEQRVADRGGTIVAGKYVSTSRSATAPERAGITTATSSSTRSDMDSTVNYANKKNTDKKTTSTKSQDTDVIPDSIKNIPFMGDTGNYVKLPGDQGFVYKGGAFGEIESPETPIPTMTDRTGMTATPSELSWTFEGAVEESKRTGESIQNIQKRNLDKWDKVGTSAEDMALNKKYYIGKDESGTPQYIQESPYQVKFDYTPNDPDYSSIKSSIKSNIGSYDTTISNVSKINESSSILESNLQNIRSSAPGTRWSYELDPDKLQQENPDTYNWIKENIGFKEEYNKSEAEKLTQYLIDENKKTLESVPSIQSLKEDRENLQNTLFTVKQYEKLGYEVDKTDEGYEFALPEASEVHSKIFGDKEAVALTSASFMESPLAIKTFASGIYQWATGDEKVGETRREELAQFSLGLYESTGKGDYGGYIGKVATSPAMVQGVYLPLIAYGGGYALTGLSAGASGTVSGATSTLARIGATQGGRVLTVGSKIGMAGIGAYGLKTTGESLYKTYQERPEALPGQLAETGFTFGMAYAGFRKGKTMYNYRNPSVGAPRDTLFKRMGETYKNKIVGRSKLLSNVYEKLDVLKEQKNIAKMYKPTTLGRITGKIGRTVFNKQYQRAVRDYPKALASDQIAFGKKMPMYEYKDYPDYTPTQQELFQQQSAFSKYLKMRQPSKITDVKITDAQLDIFKPGELSFEAKIKGITDKGTTIEAGRVRGVAKTVGSGEDDIQYSIYKALYSRGKNIQESKTQITGLGGDSPGFSKTTIYPARETFNYRQWLQGVTRSEKIGEYTAIKNIGNIQVSENILFTKDTGMHTRGLTSSSFKKPSFSQSLTQYRTVGSGTSYKTTGNIYSNYNDWMGFFENKTPYTGSGTIADISSGKEYVGGFIKGKTGSGSNLNNLYQQQNIFDTLKPQLTDVVKESFKTGGSPSAGSYGIGDITQYEWYQAPLSSYTPTTQIVGSVNLSGYAGAYGFTNLATLDFLEEGTQQTSSKWTGVKPSSRRIISPSSQQTTQNLLPNQDVIKNIGIGEINLLKEGTGTIQIDKTKTDYLRSPETDSITETTKKTDLRKDIISKVKPMMKQSTSQSMKQLMKQDTAQVLQLQQAQQLQTDNQFFSTPAIINPSPPPPEFIDTPSPPPPEIPEYPSPPPPKIIDNTPKQRIKRRIKTKTRSKPRVMKKGEGDKGLLADLLSVTRSQARYGVATHPKLSKETWKEGAKTLYSRVLTKELKQNKKNKKKKPKLLRRNKDVFI